MEWRREGKGRGREEAGEGSVIARSQEAAVRHPTSATFEIATFKVYVSGASLHTSDGWAGQGREPSGGCVVRAALHGAYPNPEDQVKQTAQQVGGELI